MSSVRIGIVLAGIVGVAGGALWALRQQATRADDATHATVLQTESHDFGFGGGTQTVVRASVASTTGTDDLARITISVRAPGAQTFKGHAGSEAVRNDDNELEVSWRQPASMHASGTLVRAVFQTFHGSTQTFTYTREISIP